MSGTDQDAAQRSRQLLNWPTAAFGFAARFDPFGPLGATVAADPVAAPPDKFVATVPIQLGEGIERVVQVKFRRHDYALMRQISQGWGQRRDE